MNTIKSQIHIRKQFIFLIFIIGIGAIFRIYKLNKIWLWQDEAETAVLAQTILEKPIPNAYL